MIGANKKLVDGESQVSWVKTNPGILCLQLFNHVNNRVES